MSPTSPLTHCIPQVLIPTNPERCHIEKAICSLTSQAICFLVHLLPESSSDLPPEFHKGVPAFSAFISLKATRPSYALYHMGRQPQVYSWCIYLVVSRSSWPWLSRWLEGFCVVQDSLEGSSQALVCPRVLPALGSRLADTTAVLLALRHSC